jgi:hypothetical protein
MQQGLKLSASQLAFAVVIAVQVVLIVVVPALGVFDTTELSSQGSTFTGRITRLISSERDQAGPRGGFLRQLFGSMPAARP